MSIIRNMENRSFIPMTTRIMIAPRVKLAREAVTTLDVVSKKAWSTSNLQRSIIMFAKSSPVFRNLKY
jgi:hypothetical protein